uniref:GATA-type domain-containing protein n=1 Tax=Mycena chlorophos TaxID=658473 RepID=A0ABQ0LXK4_MYCCL|nr:predicted protein [Mycena chlorophos]
MPPSSFARYASKEAGETATRFSLAVSPFAHRDYWHLIQRLQRRRQRRVIFDGGAPRSALRRPVQRQRQRHSRVISEGLRNCIWDTTEAQNPDACLERDMHRPGGCGASYYDSDHTQEDLATRRCARLRICRRRAYLVDVNRRSSYRFRVPRHLFYIAVVPAFYSPAGVSRPANATSVDACGQDYASALPCRRLTESYPGPVPASAPAPSNAGAYGGYGNVPQQQPQYGAYPGSQPNNYYAQQASGLVAAADTQQYTGSYASSQPAWPQSTPQTAMYGQYNTGAGYPAPAGSALGPGPCPACFNPSPQEWRYGEVSRTRVCNACSKYEKRHGAQRPEAIEAQRRARLAGGGIR